MILSTTFPIVSKPAKTNLWLSIDKWTTFDLPALCGPIIFLTCLTLWFIPYKFEVISIKLQYHELLLRYTEGPWKASTYPHAVVLLKDSGWSSFWIAPCSSPEFISEMKKDVVSSYSINMTLWTLSWQGIISTPLSLPIYKYSILISRFSLKLSGKQYYNHGFISHNYTLPLFCHLLDTPCKILN